MAVGLAETPILGLATAHDAEDAIGRVARAVVAVPLHADRQNAARSRLNGDGGLVRFVRPDGNIVRDEV